MPEIHKFEAMLKWAKNYIKKQSYDNKVEAKIDFRACMDRLSRDLKLCRISPNDLIKVTHKSLRNQDGKSFHFICFLQIVLPSKAIKNERILETLMFQANTGMYRIHDSYLRACQEAGLRHQDSKFSESFDYT